MAKRLRTKIASMALCGVVAAVPVQSSAETTTQATAQIVTTNQTTTDSALDITETTSETSTKEESTRDIATVSLENPWEDEVAAATLLGKINIWKADSDEDSMSAGFFTKEDVPIHIENGKVSLKLQVTKDPWGISDAISKLEQKMEDGTYKTLELTYVDNEDIRYIVAEVDVEDLTKPIVLRTTITMMPTPAELRVVLTQETIEAIKAEIEAQKVPVTMSIQHTNETALSAKDGSITIEAEGGYGTYEYTIDGGENWGAESSFSQLEPGTYSVGVRDAEDTTNVTDFKEVIVVGVDAWANEVAAATLLGEIKIWKSDADEDSMSAGFFTKEDVPIKVENGKVSLKLQVTKDPWGISDAISKLEQKMEDGTYKTLELTYVDNEDIRYIVAEVDVEDLTKPIVLRTTITMMPTPAELRVVLTQETMDAIVTAMETPKEEVSTPVVMTVEKTSTSITMSATGGSGQYEYTIDGGSTWSTNNKFTELKPGTYNVGVRDIADITNCSALEKVILMNDIVVKEEFEDGYYSVDIKVLQETQDKDSMAAQFFNKKELPLYIKDGVGYLTIQVLKDGMGMTDVITSLEQRINGEYDALYLEDKDNDSVRYITTEVRFDDLEEAAYIRCSISAMPGMKPILRIVLDKDSIEQGEGNLITNFKANQEITIKSVEAENGKVTVQLYGEDEELTEEDFEGKVYLNGASTGTKLTLKDFEMDGNVVTFTYDPITATDKDQSVMIGMTLNELEIQSNSFLVKALEKVVVKGPSKISFKEDAKTIKYIKGYEDGTFRPNAKLTKAEALSMLSLLVNGVNNTYYLADIDVLQADKDEESMSAQFFTKENIMITQKGDSYFVALEIANEGLGFSDIITSIEQKVDNQYKVIQVNKSSDMKTANITLEVKDLKEAIVLRTGIAPMGTVKPELRIVIDEDRLKETSFASNYTDINMWAKDAITIFEEAGVIGASTKTEFAPNSDMTRAEFIKVIVQVAGLDISTSYSHDFKDLANHEAEAYIAAAAEAGYIKGYADGTFKPEGTLTRAEAVTIINRVLGHTEETVVGTENPFSDLSKNHWAYDEILKVVEN